MTRRIAALASGLAFVCTLAGATAIVALACVAPMLDIVMRGPRGGLDDWGWWTSDVAARLDWVALVGWLGAAAFAIMARSAGGRRVATSAVWRVAAGAVVTLPVLRLAITFALR